MFKFLRNLFSIIIIALLIFGVVNNIDYFRGQLNSWVSKVQSSIQNKSDLDSIKLSGEKVDNETLETLEASSLTGENYEFDTLFYPYYGMLNGSEKSLYKQIYANIIKLETTLVPVVSLKIEDITRIIEALINDHPELFWIDTTYYYKYTEDNKVVQLTLKYNETIDDFETAKRNFEDEANKIIERALAYDTDYEKEKFVHDTLIAMLDYDTESSLNQSAYSALVNKVSVCAGYARAFQHIMIKLDIPTYLVTGDASGSHAWNIVKLDDNYYNVDLTWNDTEEERFSYFNVSDSTLAKTHTRNDLSKNLPTCQSPTYEIVQNDEEVIDIVQSITLPD